MRDWKQKLSRDHACLKRLVLKRRLLPLMRWLRLCLRRAASNAQIIRVFILFFNSKKK